MARTPAKKAKTPPRGLYRMMYGVLMTHRDGAKLLGGSVFYSRKDAVAHAASLRGWYCKSARAVKLIATLAEK